MAFAALLTALLSGCAGGEDKATAADVKFLDLDHVVAAHTTTMHGGAPWNTEHFSTLVIDEGLPESEVAVVIDAAIGIAKAELSSANVGVALQFSTQSQALDVRDMTVLLGDLGTQSAARLSSGTISLSQDDL